MENPGRLVLFEGILGSGKSTCSRLLAEALVAAGRRAVVYHEADPDNPIRTIPTDMMLASFPEDLDPVTMQRRAGGRVLPDGLVEGAGVADPAVYDNRQWARLSDRCLAGEEVVILESRYFQNTVMPAMAMGMGESQLWSLQGEIGQLVAACAPLLIYLRPSDVEGTIRGMLAVRDARLVTWLLGMVDTMPWAQERGLRGPEALVALNVAYQALTDRLAAAHPGPVLQLDDPQRDWLATMRAIRGRVGLSLSD